MSFHSPRTNGTFFANGDAPGAANRDGTRGVADWLGFAAAPIFAAMALLTAVSDGSDMLCIGAPEALPLSGMVSMYVLMSVFHSTPWLKLISGRRIGLC